MVVRLLPKAVSRVYSLFLHVQCTLYVEVAESHMLIVKKFAS